jgi:hypothetical protein
MENHLLHPEYPLSHHLSHLKVNLIPYTYLYTPIPSEEFVLFVKKRVKVNFEWPRIVVLHSVVYFYTSPRITPVSKSGTAGIITNDIITDSN